jgi:multidrug resistance efflux pump
VEIDNERSFFLFMNATNISVALVQAGRAKSMGPSTTEALAASLSSRWRRWLFRGVRLSSASGLAMAAVYFGQQTLTRVESDQAYINGMITPQRAPIGGHLKLESLELGALVQSGTVLFQIENPRFGNLEAMSQLNWIRELVDRLRAEVADTELRHAKQEQIFQHYEALFRDKLISKLEFIEQESKVAICSAALDQKKGQLRSAETRVREIEQHLALQKQASVAMPFDGVIWSVRVQNGSEIDAHETVLHLINPARLWVDAFVHEKHADKFRVGTRVLVRTVDGKDVWNGQVESVRAGVGRMDPESCVAAPPVELSRRRVAVRVKLDAPPPFTASQFFGVGRSVVVSLPPDVEAGILPAGKAASCSPSESRLTGSQDGRRPDSRPQVASPL